MGARMRWMVWKYICAMKYNSFVHRNMKICAFSVRVSVSVCFYFSFFHFATGVIMMKTIPRLYICMLCSNDTNSSNILRIPNRFSVFGNFRVWFWRQQYCENAFFSKWTTLHLQNITIYRMTMKLANITIRMT